jgi:signal transduction histidine kinase
MRELMIRSSGHVIYNGKHYFEKIVKPNSEQASQSGVMGGNYLYRLDDRVWLYSIKKLELDKSIVTQLFATDVTELDNINTVLKENQQKLMRRQKQLRDLVENIEEICRSEELLRLRTSLHDAQNQKLTVLLRHLRQEALLPDDICPILEIDHFFEAADNYSLPADPQTELDSIVNGYEQAGVKLTIDGNMPMEKDKALALVDVLREAVANAIIHGYANEIYSLINSDNNGIVMRITDNSSLTPKKIREGTGISEIRRRIKAFGGSITINTDNGFALEISIPG